MDNGGVCWILLFMSIRLIQHRIGKSNTVYRDRDRTVTTESSRLQMFILKLLPYRMISSLPEAVQKQFVYNSNTFFWSSRYVSYMILWDEQGIWPKYHI
ncbi:hypothetical protein T4B_7719 [Trichinella pseudospiralis]|uniref:PiggyBac transposable element-derived protein domain-containing protein n=1 Tax=Trichinella pseudospiralis TaxID=6337 RepID=A0A0V1IXY5_TRIPS|nr:hypothetical protein T4B_7719 [Trichinella pseudospiralis]KRZ33059.1 hypothetical protein T4C_10444 [Trichinella pseudospiralis]